MVVAHRSSVETPTPRHCTAHPTQPYVLIPDGLIEAHVRDPLAVGVYVAVARLALIRKGAVPLSAAELAAWAGSDTEADRAAIMRRIVKLEQSGWLLVSRMRAHKHILLPTWGVDRAGTPHPWRFDQPASGRPEHVRGRRVPLALLDGYLGQLKPQQGRGMAIISRYVSCPLLDLTDIGTYTIRLRTEIAPTARLIHLDLTSEMLPRIRALLLHAASGMLTTVRGGESIGVGLTEWGSDQLDITHTEAACRSISRSVGRSPEWRDHAGDASHSDAEHPSSTPTNADNAWDVGIMESTNMESPPNVVDLAGGGRSAPAFDLEAAGQEQQQTVRTISEAPDQLSAEIVASHQALNGDRLIFPGEWWELLALQDRHGEQQLLIWQARAVRAERTRAREIRPSYYTACAARAALETYRPPRRQHAPLAEPPARAAPSLPAPPSPTPVLDPACAALLVQMGIRERDKLVSVPLALIQQWAAVVDHAGLAARFDDPRAFAHTQLQKGQAPPSRAELDRWAERVRTCAAAAPPPALSDEHVAQIRARSEAIEARAAAIAPADCTDGEHLNLVADLERGRTDVEALHRLHERRAGVSAPLPTPEQICAELLANLQTPLHRALWPLLKRIELVVEGDVLRIVCRNVVDLGVVEARFATHIRLALREYAWQPEVRTVAQSAPPVPAEVSPAPPAWIAPDRWVTLPGLMRTMLLGATLQEGALRCVSPTLTAQVQTRYGRELAMLVAAVQEEVDHDRA